MKVILQQDIRGKGKRGQMIEVSDGYARNYMLPRKMAIEATPDNVNTMDMTVVVKAKGGGAGRLFGAVTTQESADALKQTYDITLDKRKIVLDEQIKTVGLYTVRCKLGYEITADLKIKIEEK